MAGEDGSDIGEDFITETYCCEVFFQKPLDFKTETVCADVITPFLVM
jgi:hypothetical protein